MQQPQMGGKGAGKGMSTLPVSQANNSEPSASAVIDQGYRSNLQTQQAAQPSGGKGIAGNAPNPNQMTPDGGNMTVSATSGQAQTGHPNPYANTTGSWDNQSNQQPQAHMGGKGKGA